MLSLACRNVVRRARHASPRYGSRLASNKVESSEAPPPPDFQTQLANITLASALFGFCGFVFTYSMNAVGKADGNGENADPLAQLKAEAQEARADRERNKAKRISKEEIEALESGMNARGDIEGGSGQIEVAVAAPEDIARLEEEANLRAFQRQGEQVPKKKPWWRFGF